MLTRSLLPVSPQVETGACVKPKDRQAKILEIVRRDGEASVEALSAAFDVSAETVRRDLAALAEAGTLTKHHGGARRLRLHREGSFEDRLYDNAEAKSAIAAKLARAVEPGETLFIDTGTTTLACAEALTGVKGLTVVTNSLAIARIMGATGRTYLLGGAYVPGNDQTAGPFVIEEIGRFQADRAVLTVAALDAGAGAMDADMDEAQIARAMIANARSVTVLAHKDKFARRAAFKVCRLDEIDLLVSDEAPDGPLASELAEAGVEVQ